MNDLVTYLMTAMDVPLASAARETDLNRATTAVNMQLGRVQTTTLVEELKGWRPCGTQTGVGGGGTCPAVRSRL